VGGAVGGGAAAGVVESAKWVIFFHFNCVFGLLKY
jgi:hypothetical protein